MGDEGYRWVRAGAVIGPLIDMKAVDKVEAYIAGAVNKGPMSSAVARSLSPPVLTDVTTDMLITKEETFGSVASICHFKTDAWAWCFSAV
jgi:succinate-semialdehyde dehydrogenase/glutarate-semialdehyde dehydrogenase